MARTVRIVQYTARIVVHGETRALTIHGPPRASYEYMAQRARERVAGAALLRFEVAPPTPPVTPPAPGGAATADAVERGVTLPLFRDRRY
jgi:hypothetical protein